MGIHRPSHHEKQPLVLVSNMLRASMVLFAALLSYADAFSPGSSPSASRQPAGATSAETRASATAAPLKPGRLLVGSESLPVTGPFDLGTEGNWYVCEQPGQPRDFPSLMCFEAPEWMGLAPGVYVCTDALQSSGIKSPTYFEDSY